MKNTRFFLSEIFSFLVVKFSVYLNRHVSVMVCCLVSCLIVVFPVGSCDNLV